MEVLPLFKPGAQGLIEGHQDHVEIELVQPLFVLRAVDSAQPRFDTDAGEVLDIRLQNAFEVRIDQQYLERQRFAFTIEQALPGQFPAALSQQVQGAAHGFAGDAAAIGFRQAEGLAEQLGGQLAAPRREHQPFMALGDAAGRELAVGVVAFGPLI